MNDGDGRSVLGLFLNPLAIVSASYGDCACQDLESRTFISGLIGTVHSFTLYYQYEVC